MAETVGQHSVAAFTSPVNGTSPIDANTVKGNDNTIRSAYVDHDADPGIHVQSSTLASRPVANSAGRKWMTQDSGVIRLFYDDGTSWYEVDYLRTTGGTISGNLSITGTLAVTGVATFTAQPILSSLTASRAVFTDGSKGLVSNAITGTGDVVMSASPTLTGTITAASATLSGTLGVSGLLTFASLKGTGATTVTNILDEDNMASDSATALATQQSIKAYVDAQVGASDALSEVLAIGNTTGANDIIVSAGQKIRTPAVAAQDGSSAITIANTTGALTLATALADSNLATISTAGKVSNSATTATSANTASAIVARDASGNFTAGTITAALTGNASTATTLQTARNINGVSFNGSADITVTAAAGTLTGTTLASNVTASSLTSVGTLANLTVTNPITGSVTGSSGSTTGNAATATALQTARNINGVSFNGTADITVTAAAGTLTGTTLASGVTASSLTSVGTLSSLTVSGVLTLQSQTTLPANVRSFDIAATTAAQQFMHIGTSGSDAYIGTAASTGGGLITGSQAYAMEFRNDTGFSFGTGATERMRLDASGNLGIGRTPSGYTLDITTGGNALRMERSGVEMGGFISSGNPFWGTLTNHPFLLMTNGTERARIDASGNLGLGVTPSAFGSGWKALQIGSGGPSIWTDSGRAFYTSNVYFDGTNRRYVTSNPAVELAMDGGAMAFKIAASGTAGNAISFTQAMTLDASSNLTLKGHYIIDDTSSGIVSAQGTGASALVLNGRGDIRFTTGGTPTGGTERARIDSAGNLGLGVTPSAWDTSVFRTVQIGTGAGSASLSGRSDGSKDMLLASNVYYGAGNFRYIANGIATQYRTDGGTHSWSSHPSGTAGNALSAATATMTLDASGNLGVGVTSMAGSGNLYLAAGKYLGYSASTYMTPEDNVQGARIKTPGGIVFEAGGTERARITSGGDFLVNCSSGNGKLSVRGPGTTTGYSFEAANSAGTTRFIVQDGGLVQVLSNTSGTESARFTSGGYFKASNAGTYAGATGSYHELRNSTDNSDILYVTHTGTSGTQYGVYIKTNNDQNDATRYFISAVGNTTERFTVRSNGGIANYSANDVNLASDERLKKDIAPLSSTWNKLKAIEVVNYRYKDCNEDDPALYGVIAQQVQPIVPELVVVTREAVEAKDAVLDEDGNEVTPAVEAAPEYYGIREQPMYWLAIKALQEAQNRIESLEARLAALES